MKTQVALVGAFFALVLPWAALADGVPLITPGSNNAPVRALSPGFVKQHPIKLNPGAFGSNVLTVVVDGTEYRFVGSTQPDLGGSPKSKSWIGEAPVDGQAEKARLTLTKVEKSGMLVGTLTIPPSRGFDFTSNNPDALAEFKPVERSEPPARGYVESPRVLK